MSGRPLPLAGRVAVVTGAARGQGRSHACRLAADGASIVAIDVCADIPSAPYTGATPADLEQTLAMIDAAGAHGASAVADVRDLDALTRAVDEGLDALVARGAIEQRRLDVVVANAGIAGGAPVTIMDAASWREMIDIDLTGVWNTIKASVPSMIEAGHGGSIVIISSANGGLKAPPNLAHYASAKHGLVGMMRSLANELGAERIRVNTVHPTAVDTSMIHNEFTYRLFRPDLDDPGRDDVVGLFASFHSLPIAWIEPSDVSEAVAFLASDAARYVTGICLPIDGGLSAR